MADLEESQSSHEKFAGWVETGASKLKKKNEEETAKLELNESSKPPNIVTE